MKRFKYIIIVGIVLSGLFVNSCSDKILDTMPLDKYTEQTIWSNPGLADGFIASVYSIVMPDFIDKYGGFTNGFFNSEQGTDNLIRNADISFAKENFDTYSDFGWKNMFDRIRRCNLIIENVGKSNFPDAQKKVMIAEGKMLRAITNYTRARLYGKLIIVDKVLTPDDNLKMSRTSTIKETYDFILKDLADAAIDLPATVALGRLSKGAALALRAEVALQGAAYAESGAANYYQEAIKDSKSLFGLGFTLDSNYKSLFNDFNFAKGSSKELILAFWRNKDNTTLQDGKQMYIIGRFNGNSALYSDSPQFDPNDIGGGWTEFFPTVSLADAYLVMDNDGVAKKWNETSYYQNFVAKGGSVDNAIYKNRDLRFDASLLYDSCKFFNSRIYIRDGHGGNMHWNSNYAEQLPWFATKSGYYFRKGIYEIGNSVFNTYEQHVVILRLGRSYLNYAEALLRTGDVNGAIEYINKTRQVHGGLSAIPSGTSVDKTWEWYKIERRVDLFDECDRYWSLLRWAKADGKSTVPELTENPLAINIAADGRSFQIIPLPANLSQNTGKVFTSRRFLLPVPQGERLLNTNLDQNPGW